VDSPTGEINELHVIDGKGNTRSFDIIVSPDYQKSNPAAVIFDLHGRGDPKSYAKGDGFQYAISDARDQGISVFPQGAIVGGSTGWSEGCGSYDMVLFDNMLKYLSDNYCVNPNKIFASGFSWGGDMVNSLACCSDTYRAIAPISGPRRVNNTCPAKKWSSIWMRYGTSDASYTQNQFTSTRDFYSSTLACDNTPQPLAGDDQCVSYNSCTEPLIVCARPMGHDGLIHAEAAQIWNYWRTLPDKQ